MSLEQKPKATRQSFGESLAALGSEFPKIVVCEADLSKSTKSELFAKKFPERFFQMGIAEANMIGTGSGLAVSGFVPFICSFGAFVTGRYDQIRMSVAYAGAAVRIVGTHAGVGIGDDGHSQMGLEDLSLMRELPTMLVLQPCDDVETQKMMRFLVSNSDALKKPAYLRLTRQALRSVHSDQYEFRLDKLDILKTGSKVALLGTGAGVQEVMAAAAILESKNIKPTIVNVPVIKPFDSKGLIELTKTHSLVVTVEDHSVLGGLGSACAETMAENPTGAKLIRVGIQDVFGESGEPIELYEKHKLTGAQIAATVLEGL